MKPVPQEILQTLAARIREIESRPYSPSRAIQPLGIPPLEDLFPQRQLPAGALVEMVSLHEGDGAGTLALGLARRVCADGRTIILAEEEGTFYPPGAAALASEWASCIVVRPRTLRESHLVTEYALRCPAVGAVVARGGHLSVPVARRLQAAAEMGGGIGLILRSATALTAPVFSTLRLVVRTLPAAAEARRLHIDVAHCRGNAARPSFLLELDHETGDVRLPAGVAAATTRSRTAGTSR